MTKLCSECKWSRGQDQFLECWSPHNPVAPGYEFVSPLADPPKAARYCSAHRAEDWLSAIIFGLCGRRGRWWEPNP